MRFISLWGWGAQGVAQVLSAQCSRGHVWCSTSPVPYLQPLFPATTEPLPEVLVPLSSPQPRAAGRSSDWAVTLLGRACRWGAGEVGFSAGVGEGGRPLGQMADVEERGRELGARQLGLPQTMGLGHPEVSAPFRPRPARSGQHRVILPSARLPTTPTLAVPAPEFTPHVSLPTGGARPSCPSHSTGTRRKSVCEPPTNRRVSRGDGAPGHGGLNIGWGGGTF